MSSRAHVPYAELYTIQERAYTSCFVYQTTAAKAARETDFYRIEADDIDPDDLPPLLVETLLSNVDGAAVSAIDELIANGAWTSTHNHRWRFGRGGAEPADAASAGPGDPG